MEGVSLGRGNSLTQRWAIPPQDEPGAYTILGLYTMGLSNKTLGYYRLRFG